MLEKILRILSHRCPACFKPVKTHGVRHGRHLFCSTEHRDQYVTRQEKGGKCC